MLQLPGASPPVNIHACPLWVLTETVWSEQAPATVLTYDYGSRTDGQPVSVSATVDGVADFVNLYEYDSQARMTHVRQTGGDGGIVLDKHVALACDAEGQLEQITRYASLGTEAMVAVADCIYDALGRRIAKQIDEDGDGPEAARSEAYVYLGEHIALAFTTTTSRTRSHPNWSIATCTAPTLQLLADEQVGAEASTSSHLIWPLGDHLGTIRDLAERDLVSGLTVVVSHMTYDTFGRVWTSTTPSAESRFAFTGRDLDPESDLYHYRARYYDPATGQFISADPIGFEAGDGNLYRYVGNGPIDGTDPSGLKVQVGCRDIDASGVPGKHQFHFLA